MILLSTIIVFIGAIAGAIILAAIVNGYVLSILWGWFFVPLLGLPALSIPGAIGIVLVVGYLTHQYEPSDEGKGLESICGTLIVRPILVLLMGWVVQHWI